MIGAAAFALAFNATQIFAQDKGKGAPAPAAAAEPAAPQQNPNVWYKLCLDVPVKEAEKKDGDKSAAAPAAPAAPAEVKKVNICLTQVDVRDKATAILVGKIAVRQLQGAPKPQILTMLPLSVSIPSGALVKIDDKEPVKLAYTTCDQAGCYAEAEVDPAVIDQMKTGKLVAYYGIDLSGKTIAVPLPLDGFATAFAGAPVPVEKYNEDQKKIAEVIKEKLIDLRKKEIEAVKAAGGAQAPEGQPATTAPKN
jgi:invasion protein IalB